MSSPAAFKRKMVEWLEQGLRAERYEDELSRLFDKAYKARSESELMSALMELLERFEIFIEPGMIEFVEKKNREIRVYTRIGDVITFYGYGRVMLSLTLNMRECPKEEEVE